MQNHHRRSLFTPIPFPVQPAATPNGVAPPVAAGVPTQRDRAGNDAPPVASAQDHDATPDAPAPERRDVIDDASRLTHILTVEETVVRLDESGVYREPRTVQRWCKTGRLDCLIDAENGERYLIEPGSVDRVVATLRREREKGSRHDARHGDGKTRPASPRVGSSRDHDAPLAATRADTPRQGNDKERDIPATEPAPAQASDPDARSRVQQLENELAMAKADKQVREQMVEGALDRSEQVGQLKAENEQLRGLIEAPRHKNGDNDSGVWPDQGVQYRHEGNSRHGGADAGSPAAPLHHDLPSDPHRARA